MVAVAVVVTVATVGTGLVGTALIAGTLAAGANVFNQTVIEDKSFAQVDWVSVGIDFLATSISSLIPGNSFTSLLMRSFTNASLSSLLKNKINNTPISFGQIISNTFVNLTGEYINLGLNKVSHKILSKIAIDDLYNGLDFNKILKKNKILSNIFNYSNEFVLNSLTEKFGV